MQVLQRDGCSETAAAGSEDRWEEGREHLEALRCLIRDTAGSHIVLGKKNTHKMQSWKYSIHASRAKSCTCSSFLRSGKPKSSW